MKNTITSLTHSNDGNPFTKSARELHQYLQVGRDFTNWFKYQADSLPLIENRDFTPIVAKSTGGRPGTDYLLTPAAANRMATHSQVQSESANMVKDNFAGKALTLDNIFASPEVGIAMLIRMMEQNQRLEIAEAKAKEYNALMKTETLYSFKEAADHLAIQRLGRNNLCEFLREKGVLNIQNVPYRRFVEAGYFKRVSKPFTDRLGRTRSSITTVVTGKGLEYILRLAEAA